MRHFLTTNTIEFNEKVHQRNAQQWRRNVPSHDVILINGKLIPCLCELDYCLVHVPHWTNGVGAGVTESQVQGVGK